MVTSLSDAEKALKFVDEVKEELKKEKIPFSDEVEIGIMIETPAAAIISDKLAPLFDFFSIGTNDLLQYTLACDRQNPDLEEFFDPHHEAVIRLIDTTVKNAHKNRKWVGICGELAGDTELTRLFLEMSIDELSVAPSHLLKLRDTVRKIDLRKKE
jgi:phosphotransferase system enzyme I (PtsI)